SASCLGDLAPTSPADRRDIYIYRCAMESSTGLREGEGMPARISGRAVGALIALAAICAALLSGASSARAQPGAAQRLADRYAPIVKLRKQTDGICDSSEEQYSPPTSVNSVLGNRKVRLLKTVGRRTVVLV